MASLTGVFVGLVLLIGLVLVGVFMEAQPRGARRAQRPPAKRA